MVVTPDPRAPYREEPRDAYAPPPRSMDEAHTNPIGMWS